jgi:hypothetical protein
MDTHIHHNLNLSLYQLDPVSNRHLRTSFTRLSNPNRNIRDIRPLRVPSLHRV